MEVAVGKHEKLAPVWDQRHDPEHELVPGLEGGRSEAGPSEAGHAVAMRS